MFTSYQQNLLKKISWFCSKRTCFFEKYSIRFLQERERFILLFRLPIDTPLHPPHPVLLHRVGVGVVFYIVASNISCLKYYQIQGLANSQLQPVLGCPQLLYISLCVSIQNVPEGLQRFLYLLHCLGCLYQVNVWHNAK